MVPHKPKTGLTVLLVLAVYVLSGVVAVLATQRWDLKIDLTEEKLYTLSEETQAVLEQLESPVVITVMNSHQEYPIVPRNLLERYARGGNSVRVRWCDPYLEPLTVRAYEEAGYRVELNDLMVEAGGRCEQLKLTDLYELSSDGTQVTAIKAEQAITSAIANTARTQKDLVLFTDGHGEQPGASLMELIEENHFETAYTTLSVLGIEDRARLLCICDPERDFTAEDIAQVEAFLNRGGSVLVFLEPGAQTLENLSAFLADWGIEPGEGAVEEPRLYVSGSAGNVAATYASHEINRFFTNNRYYVIVPACMPLRQAYISRGNTKTQQVLSTSGSGYVVLEDGSRNENAPFALAVSAQRDATLDGQTVTGRMVVIGSKRIYGDDLLASPSLANRDFLAQCAAWCVGESEWISIPPKEMGQPYLPMVAGEAQAFMLLMMIAIPSLLLGFGVVTAIRRRRL